ncbi:hypothetical protein [Adhaeretor mobilis]|nr:hypothetical protein [Adhaeretor mobilis]
MVEILVIFMAMPKVLAIIDEKRRNPQQPLVGAGKIERSQRFFGQHAEEH